MATFIKAGFWEKLCKPCKGYKGWLNLDEFVKENSGGPSYKVYTATITYNQDEWLSTNVLQNTLGGSLTIELDSPGQSKFTVTSSGLFTLDKTFVLMNSPAPLVGTTCTIEDEDQLFINFDSYGTSFSGTKVGFLEIRVYP